MNKIVNGVANDFEVEFPQVLTRWQDPTIDEMKNRINDLLKENTEWKLENERLNNIINQLEAMFDGDLDGFSTINEKGACNEIIEVIQNYKDKLKELKEGNNETKKEC